MLAALGGLLLGLATPPFDLWVLVLPALVLLRVAAQPAASWRQAAGAGFVWALAGGLLGLRFVPSVVERFSALGTFAGIAAWIVLASVQALPWAFALAVSKELEQRWHLPGPIAFAIGVFTAISLPAVFPWTPAGLMSPWLALIQGADIVGERGVSFLLGLTMAWVAQLAASRERWWRPVGATFIALGGLVLYGHWRLATLGGVPPAAILRVGLVQPMLAARLQRSERDKQLDLQTLQRLTLVAETRGAQLTIWPEASYPYRLPHQATTPPRAQRQILAKGARGPLLFGAVTASGGDAYNSALTLHRDGSLGEPQHKLRPLWFGEAVPLADVFPSLARLSPRAIRAGKHVALQLVGQARIGVVNCYEDTLPDTARRIALARPNLLVAVTNDAWFEGSWEPELHLRLAVLRAVESRLDLVRAVNGAAAGWIDAKGQVRATGDAKGESVLMAAPALREHMPTWFIRVGNTPIWLAIAALVSFFLFRGRLKAARPDLIRALAERRLHGGSDHLPRRASR